MIGVIPHGCCCFASLPSEPVGDGRVLLEDGAGLPRGPKGSNQEAMLMLDLFMAYTVIVCYSQDKP